jgi:hypothetical protein
MLSGRIVRDRFFFAAFKEDAPNFFHAPKQGVAQKQNAREGPSLRRCFASRSNADISAPHISRLHHLVSSEMVFTVATAFRNNMQVVEAAR